MKNTKFIKIAIVIVLLYLVFTAIVVFFFQKIQNNPIDQIAKSYIYNSDSFKNEYGEIFSIGKNILYDTKESENTLTVPYTVETFDNNVIIYVTLEKEQSEWCVKSFEVIEVNPK